jgi:ankyrin repeat protein
MTTRSRGSSRDAWFSEHCTTGAKGGHDEIVRLLLDHGASVADKDYRYRTPLYWASVGGHEKIADELLS